MQFLMQRERKVIKNELNEKEKKIVFLYYDERLTLEEISKLYNVSPSAIWKQLKRIKRKLYVFLKYVAELHYGRTM